MHRPHPTDNFCLMQACRWERDACLLCCSVCSSSVAWDNNHVAVSWASEAWRILPRLSSVPSLHPAAEAAAG